jgi:hypothetical protein
MPRVKHEKDDDEEEEEEFQPEAKKAKVKKDEEDGDEDENADDEENETAVKCNADGEAYFELGTKKRCTVRKWNNNVLVDIREVNVALYLSLSSLSSPTHSFLVQSNITSCTYLHPALHSFFCFFCSFFTCFYLPPK